MRMTKKVTSIVLAVLMVVSMVSVMAVSASALTADDADFEVTLTNGTVKYVNWSGSVFNSGDGTYKLLKDINPTTRTAFGLWSYDITLDLNGHVITSSAPDAFIIMGRGGSASKPRVFTVKSSKSSGGKILCTGLSSADSSDAVISTSGGYNVVNIASFATIEAGASVVTLTGSNQTLNVTGGTLKVNGNDFVIATNGASTHGATINISGGTITSTGATAIYQPSDGTLNISGGTITGTTGVYVKGGTTNITGGTIKATGAKADYNYNGNGANATGDALVVDNCGYPSGSPVVSVTGGSFTSANAQPVASYVGQDDPDYTGDAQPQVVDFISGGTFKSTSDTVDADEMNKYMVDASYDSTKGTVTSDHVAMVNGVYYDTFAEAVESADAQAGAVVVNLKKPATGDKATLRTTNLIDNPIRTTVWYGTANWNAPDSYTKKYYTEVYDGIKVNCNYVKPASVMNTTTGKGYTDIMSAINEAADGDVIDLTESFTTSVLAETATVKNKKVTLNLNGFTTNFRDVVIGEDGELVINGDNGSLNSTYNGAFLVTKGNLSIDKANIKSTGGFAIASNGSAGNNGYEINITDSTITSTKGAAIYQCNNGTLNLKDTDVTGPTALYIKSGTTTIDGGTFHATGEAAEFTHNGNGINGTGDAIVVENCNYPGGAPTVSITDGTFTSDNNKAVAGYTYAGQDTVNNFISGGNFSSDVSEFATDGNISTATGAVAGAPFVITPDPNPLNPVDAETITDGNAFGLSCKYLKGTLLGVQKKDKASVAAPETSESNQEGDKNMRFVAVLDTDLLNSLDTANGDDYGFVLAKVNSNKTYDDTNIDNLKINMGNGEKKLSAVGTKNNVCGNEAYGDPDSATVTSYKYVTCAVNNVTDSDKIVARFYVTKDGKTYYAKYAGHNYNYTGAIAAWSDLTD